MANYVRLTGIRLKFFDANGLMANGYKIYQVQAGTSNTLITTYQVRNPNGTLSSPNANPIVLPTNGECDVLVTAPVKIIQCLPTSTGPTDGVIDSVDWLGDLESNVLFGASVPTTLNNNYVVNVSPAPLSLTNTMLIMVPDVDNQDTLIIPVGKTSPTVFTGTGINDGIFTGPYIGSTPNSIFTVEIDSVAAGLDANMKLLLHGDGTGASFVDSSASVHAVTAHGGATQSTVQSKFGGKSALFANAGDYLSCLDSDDWFLSDSDFTLEAWVYFSSVADATFMAQYQDANNLFRWDYINSSHKLRFYSKDSSTVRADYDYVWTPTAATWYHLAVVRSGSSFLLFINGTLTSWTNTTTAISTNTLGNLTGLLTIGYNADPAIATNFLGYMDEVCWSNGIARWVATFVPATQAYGGTYDTLKWQKDGPTWNATGIPIIGNNVKQILIEDVAIAFAEITGHTVGDIWIVTVMTPTRVLLNNLPDIITYPNGWLVYKNLGGTLVAISGSDIKANIAALLIPNPTAACYILTNPSTAAGVSLTQASPRPRKELITDYDLLQADAGDELSCSGTFTITLLPAPNFVNNFVDIKNIGTGNITIDGGTYKIVGDGTTTYILGPGQSLRLITNGTDWHILFITYSGGRVEYTTAGTYTWTVPGGVNFIKRIVCVGAGSGGGSTYAGAGGAVEIYGDYPVTPGQTITVVVGAGSAANSPGGVSSFDTLPSAAGGAASTGGADGAGGTVSQTASKYRVNQVDGYDGNHLSYNGGASGMCLASFTNGVANAPGGGGGQTHNGADGAVYISY